MRYEYYVLHRPVKVIDPDDDTDPTNNPVWQTLYNAADEVIATIDPLGRQTTYGYDALGTLVSVTTPMGFVTSYSYDAEQRLLSVTDPLGRTTSYERDARGRVIAITDPTGAKTTFSWDAVDRLVRRTDPLAGLETSQTDYQYDNLDRLIELVDAEGNRWKWEYDLVGNRIAAVDPLGNRSEWDYDARNRVIATRDLLGNQTTIAYTLTGMVAAVTDPLGHTTRYRYNARDWRTAIIPPDGDSDPNNNPEITFGYDEEGNLISLTDADGNTTQWRLDAVDRVIEEINALGLSRFFEHDAAGQLTAVVDRNGRRREFDYDLDGRRTAEKWVDGQGQVIFQINYTWDAANQLIGVSDPNQTYTLAYDDAGRIVSLDNTGSPSIYPVIQLTNTYDDAGNRIRLTDNYGTEWRYQYDSLSRMTQAELVVSGTPKATAQFAYDAASRLVRMVRFEPGSGGGWGQDPQIVTNYSYDAASRLTPIDHDYVDSQGNATPLADFAYTWDAAGQIVGYSGPEGTRTYAYDPQGQLTDVWDGQGNLIEYYRYTPNGNRTESHLDGTGYVTGADNRLLSDGTNDYEYDNEGNLIRKTNTVTGEVTEYTWDYRNRLTAVVHKDDQGNVLWSETYVYDAFNRRIAFYEDPDGPAGPEPERFTFVLHDLAQPPTAEQIARGALFPYVDDVYGSAIFAANPLADFTDPDLSDGVSLQLSERRLYGDGVDMLLARASDVTAVDLALADLLGSVREWISADGNSTASYAYDAYGRPLGNTALSGFGYTSRPSVAAGTLWYLRARAYDANVGRFVSPDPIGNTVGRKPGIAYLYVDNAPTINTDRLGLWPGSPCEATSSSSTPPAPGSSARQQAGQSQASGDPSFDPTRPKYPHRLTEEDLRKCLSHLIAAGLEQVLNKIPGGTKLLQILTAWGCFKEDLSSLSADKLKACLTTLCNLQKRLRGGSRFGIGGKWEDLAGLRVSFCKILKEAIESIDRLEFLKDCGVAGIKVISTAVFGPALDRIWDCFAGRDCYLNTSNRKSCKLCCRLKGSPPCRRVLPKFETLTEDEVIECDRRCEKKAHRQ